MGSVAVQNGVKLLSWHDRTRFSVVIQASMSVVMWMDNGFVMIVDEVFRSSSVIDMIFGVDVMLLIVMHVNDSMEL